MTNIYRGAIFALAAITYAPTASAQPSIGKDAKAACEALAKFTMSPPSMDLPSGPASIDSATLIEATARAIAERGPTPAARITPATPQHCRVVGRIAPIDPTAPPIRFQINLPLTWNGRSVQYGGGGFNGMNCPGIFGGGFV